MVVQVPSASGYVCEVIEKLPAPNPALITVVSAEPSADGAARTVALGILRALRKLAIRPGNLSPPCTPNSRGPVGCLAHREATARRVLVLVGDSGTIADTAGAVSYWEAELQNKSLQYRVVPTCPRANIPVMSASLIGALQNTLVQGWVGSPQEVVASVLRAAGITAEDYRIFISYRIEDGASYADQLFSEFESRGFSVFLDRVRIKPGASIAKEIDEALIYHSVLLVLETPLLARSSWVTREVAAAAANRLAIAALNFPSGVAVASIGNRRRFPLDQRRDFKGNRLTETAVATIVDHVIEIHNRWLVAGATRCNRRCGTQSRKPNAQYDSGSLQRGIWRSMHLRYIRCFRCRAPRS